MGLWEYITGLMTLVSGLALTEVSLRLSRLIEHRRTVTWDWLPLLTVAIGVGTLVLNWGNAWWYAHAVVTDSYSFGQFVAALLATLLLFLTVAMTLPADAGPDTNLRAYYERQAPAFWTLYALTIGQWAVRRVLVPLAQTGRQDFESGALVAVGTTLAIAIALIFLRDRRVHTVGCGVILMSVVVRNLQFGFGE